MAILKVSYDLSNNSAKQYDAMAAVVRELRDSLKILVEETDLRMTLVGAETSIAAAIDELNQFDEFPLCFITKV